MPVRRPLERPAMKRDRRRKCIEQGCMNTMSHETKPEIPEAMRIFFGPKTCWRKPPNTAMKIGAQSSRVPRLWTIYIGIFSIMVCKYKPNRVSKINLELDSSCSLFLLKWSIRTVLKLPDNPLNMKGIKSWIMIPKIPSNMQKKKVNKSNESHRKILWFWQF